MYNNKEERLYMVIDLSRQPVHATCVKAYSKEDAIEGFKCAGRKGIKISNVTEIPITRKEDLDTLPQMQRDLILKSLEEYIYFNPFRGRWQREVNKFGDNRDILNTQPGSSSGKRMILYLIDIPFQSDKAKILVDFLTNVEKINMNDVCYSTYDYRQIDGSLNLTPADFASDDYDSFGFVVSGSRYDDIGLIHDKYKDRAKQPAIYVMSNTGSIIDVNKTNTKGKEVLNAC